MTKSELRVQAARKDLDRAAVGVVGGIGDQLVVGGHRDLLGQRPGIVGFEDPLTPVVERAVADQDAEPAGGDEVAVVVTRSVADGRAHAQNERVFDRRGETCFI